MIDKDNGQDNPWDPDADEEDTQSDNGQGK